MRTCAHIRMRRPERTSTHPSPPTAIPSPTSLATYNDVPGDSKDFERKYHVTYPSVRDVGLKLAQDYNTHALPETFVIDRNGKVVAISRGQVSDRFLANAVQKALRS